PRDQVMLVTMNDAVQVTQEFTNDSKALLAALDLLETQVGRHVQYLADHRRLIRTIQSARLFPQPVGLESAANFESAILDAERTAFDVRQLAERKVQKAIATCKALTEFTDSLAGMPGRKAVLYVSDGLQTRPADSLAQAWTNKFENWIGNEQVEDARDDLRDMALLFGSRKYDVSNRVEEMVKHASASGVTFYPIARSSRLLRGGGGSAEFGGSGTTTGRSATSQDVATLEQFSLESSLLDMAAGTGGVAFTRTSNLGGLLELMVSDFENFYSVGYNRLLADEDFHEIEVKMKDRDLTARFLRTYREKDPISHLQDLTLSALHYGVVENTLDVRLDPGDAVETGKNRYQVPITIKIPFQNLLLLPQQDVHVGKLTIVVIARDERGGTSPFQQIEVPLRIPNTQILEVLAGVAAYPLKLEMNRGKKTISVGVRDQLGRVDSTLILNLTVGEDGSQS
ncbi:MAG: VWA domain-containing protein, partial [Thermoanaerobaculia bacterium]